MRLLLLHMVGLLLINPMGLLLLLLLDLGSLTGMEHTLLLLLVLPLLVLGDPVPLLQLTRVVPGLI